MHSFLIKNNVTVANMLANMILYLRQLYSEVILYIKGQQIESLELDLLYRNAELYMPAIFEDGVMIEIMEKNEVENEEMFVFDVDSFDYLDIDL